MPRALHSTSTSFPRAASVAATAAAIAFGCCAFLALAGVANANPLPYKMGFLMSVTPTMPAAGIVHRMAIDEINASGMLGAGNNVTTYWADIANAQFGAFFRSLEAGSYGLNSTVYPPTDVLIGPLFSREAEISGGVLSTFGIPQISMAAAAPQFSDKTAYPYFSRTVPSHAVQARVIAYLCRQMGWSRVATISTTDNLGSGFLESFQLTASRIGLETVSQVSFTALQNDPQRMLDNVGLVKASGARIIILFLTGADFTAIMTALKLEKMDQPPYQLVVTSASPTGLTPGMIGTDTYYNDTAAAYSSFIARATAYRNAGPLAWRTATLSGYTTVMAYDATYLAAFALQKYIAIANSCPTYPAQVFDPPLPYDICSQFAKHQSAVPKQPRSVFVSKLITNTTFMGASGPVVLDAKGDRQWLYFLINCLNSTLASKRVGYVDSRDATKEPAFVQNAPFLFSDLTTVVPLDRQMPRPGDDVRVVISEQILILSFGICVLGAWTSLILIEQAVWNFGHVSIWQTTAWACASSTALSIGIWACVSIGLTALSFPDIPDNKLSYNPVVVFTSFLITWPLCFAAYVLMMATLRTRRVARNTNTQLEGMSRLDTKTNVEQSGTNQMDAETAMKKLQELKELKELTGAQPNRCWKYTKQAMPWIGATACLMVAVALTHYEIFFSIQVPAQTSTQGGIVVGGCFIIAIICGISIALFFHFHQSRRRWMAAFLMAIGVCGGAWTFLISPKYTYTGETITHELGASVIQIICAVLTCIASFIFIGLNVIRLRLSKDVLDRFLLQAQKKIRALEVVGQHRAHQLKESHIMLQLIAGLRPLVRPAHPLLQSLITEYVRPNIGGSPQQYDVHDDADAVAHASLDTGMPITAAPAADRPPSVVKKSGTDGSPHHRHSIIDTANKPGAAYAINSGHVINKSVEMVRPGTSGSQGRARAPSNVTAAAAATTAAGGDVVVNVAPTATATLAVQQSAPADSNSATPSPAGNSAAVTVAVAAAADASSAGPSGPGGDDVTPAGLPAPPHRLNPLASASSGGAAVSGGSGGTDSPHISAHARVHTATAPIAGSSPKFVMNGPSPTAAQAPTGSPKQRLREDSGSRTDTKVDLSHGAGGAHTVARGATGIARAVHHAPPSPLPGTVDQPAAAGAGVAGAAVALAGVKLPQPSQKITFADILSNPVTLEIFKDQVASNHNNENVAFLLDVERYRRAADDNSDDVAGAEVRRRELADDIVRTYFNAGAPHQINIDSNLRESVLAEYKKEKFGPKLFQAPMLEVRRLLERNDYARFVESSAFAVCGSVLAVTNALQDRLTLGAALPHGVAAEMLENSILKGANGAVVKLGGNTSSGPKKSSGLFGSSGNEHTQTNTTTRSGNAMYG